MKTRNPILHDPLLRKCHVHSTKPVKEDLLITAGILEYEDYGDDFTNSQNVYIERRQKKSKRDYD